MEKEKLVKYLKQRMSTRDIAKQSDVNINHRTISYWINKHRINDLMKYKKSSYNSSYFNEIDRKEKAYILGLILADGYLTTEQVSLKFKLEDRCLVEFISNEIGGAVREYKTLNREQRRFPSAALMTYDSEIVSDLNRLLGTGLKPKRHVPELPNNLIKYFLLGFFDGDGTITWGYRDNHSRIWQKISFTSPKNILKGIKRHLKTFGIGSKIKKKGDESVSIIEFADEKRVRTLLSLMYKDMDLLVLKRKKKRALNWFKDKNNF